MERRCENCSSPLDGDFCSRCGQSQASLDLPIGDFAKEVAGEALGLDSRLRRTIPPLFLKPGAVPQEFVAGRRARFVPPIRLYLFASFAMFLVLSFGSGVNVREVETAAPQSPADSTSTASDDAGAPSEAPSGQINVEFGGGELEASLEGRFRAGFERIAEDREQFSREFLGRLAQAFIFLLPGFALFLKIAYRRRLYVHHIVFAIYLHAFAFMMMTIVALPEAFGFPQVGDVLALILLVVPVYLVVGMKRFYGGTWPVTLAKGLAVSVAYNVLAGVT
ncbi:MAG: DUF3667 domain-containing protein, partial [Gemmatimonadetes bacterium]|nr:DUF3667 domain-containing protein [Gemmatimonadota bacterium]